jgi:hypothetical protein
MPDSLPESIDLEEVAEAVAEDLDEGFCLACGMSSCGVEPDAEGYRCGHCGRFEVYGAEQILLRYGD